MARTDTREQTETPTADMREEGMPTGQAPAAQRPAKPLTIAQQRQAIMEDMLAGVMERRVDLERFLGSQGISFDYFYGSLQVALMFTLKNDAEFFGSVTPTSFFAAVYKAASDGLVCDGREAAIARFKTEATYMPMVDGFRKKAHQSGLIADINSGVVTEDEDKAGRFEYEEGSNGFIRHRMLMTRKDTDTIVAAYCVVRTVNGGEYREVVPQHDLVKIRNVSKALKGPRKDWPLEMDRKAPFRRIFKRLPHDKGLAQLLKHDDEAYKALPSVSAAAEAERPQVPTEALFAPKATHKAETKPETTAESPPKPAETKKPAGGRRKKKDDPIPSDDAVNQGPIIDEMLKMVRAAKNLGELAEAFDDLKNHKRKGELTEASRKIVNDAYVAKKEELTAAFQQAGGSVDVPPGEPETDDQIPSFLKRLAADKEEKSPLEAIMRTGAVARVFDTEEQWRDDILNKMASLNGADLKTFWSRNEQFVRRAQRDGYAAAERVLAVAEHRGLI
jgi:recombination protein RecT